MFVSNLSELSSRDFDRINIVGLTGSGKSTLARQLAKTLQSECIEMDCLFHEPNWGEPEESVFRQRVEDAIQGDRWVLDGNYHSKTQDLKWKRATMVVWLDTPLLRNMWQSTTRAIHRAWTQEELWPGTGNRESFARSFFSHDSILLWALTNYPRLQKRYRALRDSPEFHLPFVHLRTRRETNQFQRYAKSTVTA